MQRKHLTLLGCGLAVVLFFAINIISNETLRSFRLDLTEDKVFTLDEGSKTIARGVEEPIHLYFYLSRKTARAYPDVLEYADRVLGMLREFERASSGNIRLSVIDPEPFSEEEDRAVEQGLEAANPDGNPLYFGLVGTNATGDRETIPFLATTPEKQRTVEYDLSKLIWTLVHPKKRKLGILSALPLEGSGAPMFGQQGEPRWKLLDQMEGYFDVKVLPTASEELGDIDILAVIHPRGFSDKTLYLVDQWALAGKPLVVFVDPRCDVDPGASDDPSNPMSRYTSEKGSDMPELFKAWGFELAKGKIACDRELGIRQPARSRDGRSQTEVPYVFLLRFGKDNVSHEDPVTRLLENLIAATPGSLRALPEAGTTFTPILQTSEESQEVESSQFQLQADPQELLASFVPGRELLTIGARVTGTVKSAFPDGPPGTTEEPAEAGAEEGATKPKTGLAESAKPLDLVVFSDADMLHDRLCIRELGRLGATMLYQPLSQNYDLFRNAVESVAGGQELMGIRVRGESTRPFERVQEIQREADQRFLARQQDLERKLQDAERRLRELQSATTEGSRELVTTQQREEEEKVREEFVQTRRDLRDVSFQLRKDIENLGFKLKWINIGLVPALVCFLAIGLGMARTRRRARG